MRFTLSIDAQQVWRATHRYRLVSPVNEQIRWNTAAVMCSLAKPKVPATQ